MPNPEQRHCIEGRLLSQGSAQGLLYIYTSQFHSLSTFSHENCIFKGIEESHGSRMQVHLDNEKNLGASFKILNHCYIWNCTLVQQNQGFQTQTCKFVRIYCQNIELKDIGTLIFQESQKIPSQTFQCKVQMYGLQLAKF